MLYTYNVHAVTRQSVTTVVRGNWRVGPRAVGGVDQLDLAVARRVVGQLGGTAVVEQGHVGDVAANVIVLITVRMRPRSTSCVPCSRLSGESLRWAMKASRGGRARTG